ncbi:MAG: hypothetical protein HY308_02770 [Gammaproteobacteria bacterium]|nr:hypothetical protein [Gammaproteobacteria bacterium]
MITLDATHKQRTAPTSVANADRYVSQFLLGPRFVDTLREWQHFSVTQHLKLTAHPTVSCTQITAGSRELTLLGHLLDPLNPDAGNREILQDLLDNFRTHESLMTATNRLGGRWLLIAADERDVFLFHDALGLRQAFYTDPAQTGALWAMSQPGIGREVLELVVDESAKQYMDSQTFRRTSESRWPAAATPFKELKHLLPNHRLNLQTGNAERYWPTAPIERLTAKSALDRFGILLTGTIRAAANRFPLTLALTAGLDSRVVLAAARGIVDQVEIITVRQGKLSDRHPDIDIPARLLKTLRLPHDIIRAAPTMTPEFSWQFKNNVYLAHDHYGHDAEALLQRFGRSRATLTGSGAEVGRCPFRAKLPHADYVHFTPELLAWLEYGSTQPFLVHHFSEWLADAGRQTHVKLLDLFEWEQDYGNWLAMTQLEFDIAWREIFTPYNCRELFTVLLGVDERYRRAPNYSLFRRFIERTWPELLGEPINPHCRTTRFGKTVANLKAVARHWLFVRNSRA